MIAALGLSTGVAITPGEPAPPSRIASQPLVTGQRGSASADFGFFWPSDRNDRGARSCHRRGDHAGGTGAAVEDREPAARHGTARQRVGGLRLLLAFRSE